MGYLDNVKVPKVNFDAKAAKAALVGAGAGLAVASEAAQGCAKYALDMMKVSGLFPGSSRPLRPEDDPCAATPMVEAAARQKPLLNPHTDTHAHRRRHQKVSSRRRLSCDQSAVSRFTASSSSSSSSSLPLH